MAKREHGSKVLDADLAWLYGGEAEAELGRHGAALEPSVRGDVDPSPSQRAMWAASKVRRLLAAVNSLPHSTQWLLKHSHEPLLPALKANHLALGDMASIVRAMMGDAATDSALRTARLAGVRHREAREEARATLARWRADAGVRVMEAVGAFRAEFAARDRAERDAWRARAERRARERFDQQWREEQVRVFGRVG